MLCNLIYYFRQRVFFREEFIPFFSNEAVNLCLFLTHVETVFRGAPQFVATSLFDNPLSRSFKALHFSASDLFVSSREREKIVQGSNNFVRPAEIYSRYRVFCLEKCVISRDRRIYSSYWKVREIEYLSFRESTVF